MVVIPFEHLYPAGQFVQEPPEIDDWPAGQFVQGPPATDDLPAGQFVQGSPSTDDWPAGQFVINSRNLLVLNDSRNTILFNNVKKYHLQFPPLMIRWS